MTNFRNSERKWVSDAWGYDGLITTVTILTTEVFIPLDLLI